MLNNNEKFIGCDKPYEEADIVIVGAPFDSTTSFRPGARFGPKAMRCLSEGLETYSPGLHRDLTEENIFDAGDIELPIGDTEKTLRKIEDTITKIIADDKFPFLLGGEHLVSLGAVRALAKKHPDLHIIHFDAHADLRDEYLGVKLSHASVMRRCWDLLGDGRIYQFGIRSGDREEFEWSKGHTELKLFNFQDLIEIVENLRGYPIYLTIDLDILDPSVLPGTGTPEAGGVEYVELLREAREVIGRSNLVGCDMVELAPAIDPSDMSTMVAGKLLREIILSISL